MFHTHQEWETITTSDPELHLPPPNDFIPTDFTIRPRPPTTPPLPQLISEDALGRVSQTLCKVFFHFSFLLFLRFNLTLQIWHKQDDVFELPKVHVKFALVSPYAYADPISSNLTRLYVDLLKVLLVIRLINCVCCAS
jgi:insulysin